MVEGRVDTVRLQRIVRTYRESATLMAAIDLEFFSQIAQGSDTEAALALSLDMEPRNVERLATACVALYEFVPGTLNRVCGRKAG